MLYPIRRYETSYNIFQPIPCVLNRFTRFLTQFYYTLFLPSWYTCSRCNYYGHCPLLFSLCQRRVVFKPDLLSQPWIFWTCHQGVLRTTNPVAPHGEPHLELFKTDLLFRPCIFWTCHKHPDTTSKVCFERWTRLYPTRNLQLKL